MAKWGRSGTQFSCFAFDEIFSDVEAHVNSEYAITWLTFENVVQEFYKKFDWSKL